MCKGPHSDFEGPKYGSTACVAVVRGNQLVVANAGDSRCVISRNGQVSTFYQSVIIISCSLQHLHHPKINVIKFGEH